MEDTKKIIILGKERGLMIQLLKSIEPLKVCSFSPLDMSYFNTKKPLKVLLHTDAYKKQPIGNLWDIRSNHKVHAKIVIGVHGCMTGSWNFSSNSTLNFHECVVYFPRSSFPEECLALEKVFDEYFERSS